LPRAYSLTLGKEIFRISLKFFAEGRPSAKKWFFEFFNPLPRAYSLALGKEIGRIF